MGHYPTTCIGCGAKDRNVIVTKHRWVIRLLDNGLCRKCADIERNTLVAQAGPLAGIFHDLAAEHDRHDAESSRIQTLIYALIKKKDVAIQVASS